MDLLFKRYADPFSFMDQMILCERFEEFVSEFIKIKNDETEEDSLWQYYLHYPFLEMSFAEFRKRLGIDKSEQPTKSDLETTVRNSVNILDGFVPDDIEK